MFLTKKSDFSCFVLFCFVLLLYHCWMISSRHFNDVNFYGRKLYNLASRLPLTKVPLKLKIVDSACFLRAESREFAYSHLNSAIRSLLTIAVVLVTEFFEDHTWSMQRHFTEDMTMNDINTAYATSHLLMLTMLSSSAANVCNITTCWSQSTVIKKFALTLFTLHDNISKQHWCTTYKLMKDENLYLKGEGWNVIMWRPLTVTSEFYSLKYMNNSTLSQQESATRICKNEEISLSLQT